jgi:HD-GYP domain-containing protein (c-di-GMP phosphodiesterase class II)
LPQSTRSRARLSAHDAESTNVAATPAPSRAELALAFAQALDLAEGREPGHAARVCYVALRLSEAVDLPPESQNAVFFAALLHDAGAAPASAEACRKLGLGEEALFAGPPGRAAQQVAEDVAPAHAKQVIEVLRAHVRLGAELAKDLGFDADVRRAIAAHHERWDGQGYPRALKGGRIALEGRIVATADLIESVITAESNPLAARRRLAIVLDEEASAALDPQLAARATDLAKSDEFWLGLHSQDLMRGLSERLPAAAPAATPDDLRLFAAVFAELADTKGEHTEAHAQRTADVAKAICEHLGMEAARVELVHLAALAHDLGLLGVPARIIAKPDILTLTEMEAMRRHPSNSQLVVQALPGLDQVATWLGAHHERPDGRGYPEMLEEDTIPLEARIIAVADTYVALTSTRPYRGALSPADARDVLVGGAGTQFDQELVQTVCSMSFDEPTSSRTVRRSRRRQ